MLERYFVKPATVDRTRISWLAPQIERYVERMDSEDAPGCTSSGVRLHCRVRSETSTSLNFHAK